MDKQQEFALRTVEERDVRFIRLWFTDVLGTLKSVAIAPAELEAAFEEGLGFDGSAIEGMTRVSEDDMIVQPDPSTFQILPWRGGPQGTARMFCDILTPDGEPSLGDPRHVLKRTLAKAKDKGFTFYVHPEIEFYLFESQDDWSKAPTPIDEGGYFDHVPRSPGMDFRRATVNMLEQMGISVEYSHHEAGPGQNEIDLRYADALTTADNIMTFRTVVKEISLERGIHAIFSDLAPHIFPTAAYEAVSERIEEYLTGKGVELHFGAKTEEAHLEDGTGVIAMSDGTTVRADIVVMCVGTRADIRWIAQDQLKMNRAIVVDPMMQTSAEGIYAAGDCCEGCDLMLGDTRNIGLYASAYVQGETAGRNMVGIPARCEGNILHNITHFMEIDFVSFGDKNLPGDRRVLLDRDGQYIEITEQNGHLVCINMLNCYALSGVVKNCILHYFNRHMQPLNREEEGVLAKSGLPNELIQILGGMAE